MSCFSSGSKTMHGWPPRNRVGRHITTIIAPSKRRSTSEEIRWSQCAPCWDAASAYWKQESRSCRVFPLGEAFSPQFIGLLIRRSMPNKAAVLGSVLLPLVGCAFGPDSHTHEVPFVAQPTVPCPGFNKKYSARATTWSQSGDDTWVRAPFHFVNAFDIDVFGHIKLETESVVME